MRQRDHAVVVTAFVSVLFNEPKLLKYTLSLTLPEVQAVSVLFNEPKLLKYRPQACTACLEVRFSALQRAEIAEIYRDNGTQALLSLFQCSSASRKFLNRVRAG